MGRVAAHADQSLDRISGPRPRGADFAMRENNATGRHAAPPPPPPVKEKTEKPAAPPAELKARRRRRSVLGGFALLAVLLLILGLSLRGAAAEKRWREHLRAAEESCAAGDYETALGHLRQASAFEDSQELRLRMVDCYEAMGNHAKALELLRQMDLGDESIRARIDALEEAREQERQAGKISIAGMELDRSSRSLILRRTSLTAEDLAHVAELYALSSLSLTEDGLRDVSALSCLGGLTMLDLSGNEISDLEPLAALTGLRTLYLDGNPIADFSPLYALEDLSMLSIREIDITAEQLSALSQALPDCAIHSETAAAEVRELTLGGLTFREDVTELDLSGRQLSELSALQGCRFLTRLDLSGNEIADLTTLMDFPFLESLDLSGNQVGDLRPLMAMSTLQCLDLADNAVVSTAPLASLTGLRELDLSNNALADFSALGALTGLEKLNLQNTGLGDEQLALLANCSSLRELNIADNPALTGEAVDALKKTLRDCTVSCSPLVYTVELHGQRYRRDLTELDLSGIGEPFDLSPIRLITPLEKLDLSGNRLESLYSLEPMEHLKELNLSNNNISDPTPLAYMFQLEKLDLSNNRIGSVTALLNLTQLKLLDLRGNKLTEEQIERLVNTLRDCEILYDQAE